MATRRTKARRAIAIAIALAGALAMIGILHLPFARAALARLGGCPVGRASAADVESARVAAVASLRGNVTATAKKRLALGFVLERTTPEDVLAWGRMHGVTCAARREGLLLQCAHVPSTAIDDGRRAEDFVISEATFAFRPQDRALVNVTAVSFELGAVSAADHMRASVARLTDVLGAPQRTEGAIDAERFARGGYATSTVTYAFRDYIAEITATSIEGRGVTLREHYVAAQ